MRFSCSVRLAFSFLNQCFASTATEAVEPETLEPSADEAVPAETLEAVTRGEKGRPLVFLANKSPNGNFYRVSKAGREFM